MMSAPETLERLCAEAAQSDDPHRTQRIELGKGAIEALPPFLKKACLQETALVVADAHTWEAAGAATLAALESAGHPARPLVLDPRASDDHLVCEDGMIAALENLLGASGAVTVIAVGSGSVNDICKVATHRRGLPYLSVPTAASMNGYTSAIAAVLSGGVKRTWSVHQPLAVFADVEVIRQAPRLMSRAGFGDLVSKPYCQADWLLSHHVRGVDYSAEAAGVLDGPWNTMMDAAEGIGAGEARATEILMETLLVSGFTMAMAGTSAPASGAEHLISHYWDMEAHGNERPIRGLHGAQVGVGTRLSSRTLARLVSLDEEAFRAAAAGAKERRRDDGWLDGLAAWHPELPPEIVRELREQIAQKQRHGSALADELASLAAQWEEVRAALQEVLVPTERLDRALIEAGCTFRPSELGVSHDHLVRTLRVCRHMRARYVNFDLLDDLGLLESLAEEVAYEVEGGAHG